MISVTSVRLEDLENEELILLAKYCAKCFDPIPFSDLVNRVRAGAACIYRYSGDADGVFILSTADNGMYLETVAGKTSVKHFDAIYKKVLMTAAACGVKSLYWYSSRPGLEKLLKRTKAKPVATLYREELL